MESPSNTALLIVILTVSGVLIILFFARLHQLRRGSKEDEAELESSPGISHPHEESAVEILDIRSSVRIVQSRESVPSESHSQRPSSQAREVILRLQNPATERVLSQATNTSIRSNEEMMRMSPQQSGHNQHISPKNHVSPPSLKYPDSLYSTSTLPSYLETTQSRSPPAYSDLSRTQSRRTIGEHSQRMTHGEGAFEAMPDLAHLEEGKRWT